MKVPPNTRFRKIEIKGKTALLGFVQEMLAGGKMAWVLYINLEPDRKRPGRFAKNTWKRLHESYGNRAPSIWRHDIPGVIMVTYANEDLQKRYAAMTWPKFDVLIDDAADISIKNPQVPDRKNPGPDVVNMRVLDCDHADGSKSMFMIDNKRKCIIRDAGFIQQFSNGSYFVREHHEIFGALMSSDGRRLIECYNIYETILDPDHPHSDQGGYYVTPNHMRVGFDETKEGRFEHVLMRADGTDILRHNQLIRQMSDRIYNIKDYACEIVLSPDKNEIWWEKVWNPTILDNHTIHYTDRLSVQYLRELNDTELLLKQYISQVDDSGTETYRQTMYDIYETDEARFWKYVKVLLRNRARLRDATIGIDVELPYWYGGNSDIDFLPKRMVENFR